MQLLDLGSKIVQTIKCNSLVFIEISYEYLWKIEIATKSLWRDFILRTLLYLPIPNYIVFPIFLFKSLF